MDIKDAAIDATIASAASKTTYGGAMATILGWVSSLDWLTIIGVLVAVGGLATNVYFQKRRDKREAALNEAQIQALNRQSR